MINETLNSTMIYINSIDWITFLSILGTVGGIFGGIPTILIWISKPRFFIKEFESQSKSIIFSIGNGKFLSKGANELNIRCLITTDGKQIGGHYSNFETNSSLGFSYKIDLMNGISIQALPRGSYTDKIVFSCIDNLPEKFEFYVFITFKQGDATLIKKHAAK